MGSTTERYSFLEPIHSPDELLRTLWRVSAFDGHLIANIRQFKDTFSYILSSMLINVFSYITIQIRKYDIAISKILRFTLLNNEIFELPRDRNILQRIAFLLYFLLADRDDAPRAFSFE
jgi:hypothetical protein